MRRLWSSGGVTAGDQLTLSKLLSRAPVIERERLAEIGARPSIGTVADSYDNAFAETTNGLYKTECVYGPDTHGWDDVDELELATLSWVHWFNEDGRPDAATTSRQPSTKQRSMLPNGTTPPGLESNRTSLHQTQCGSDRVRPGG